ncbi:sulfite exporter TauE/SafE family protein [Lacrimispora indolis]|uniref:sulfite exporter TauE/SafE family protein n=1 Tax=Lacrimispora indolis TaxID=69825 RepID=UPI00045EB5EA|nr:sulfite exporter TauE/SafE family protein [Lacrimispora indolis]
MERIFVVALSALLGGFAQAVTGFGGAIIIMIFLPLILSMNAAPALSDVITMVLSFSMFWRYRKSVRLKPILLPAGIYLAASTAAIHWSAYFDGRKLKGIFGLFLIGLSLYFFFFSGKARVKHSPFVGAVCGLAAGICGGFFGISGPPMSLYYLAAMEKKEEYLGTLNAFFSITVVFNIIARISNGFLTKNLIPYMGVGIVAILVGSTWGSRLVERIDRKTMSMCVYGLMAVAGIVAVL